MHVPDDELIGAGTGDFGLFLGFMRGRLILWIVFF